MLEAGCPLVGLNMDMKIPSILCFCLVFVSTGVARSIKRDGVNEDMETDLQPRTTDEPILIVVSFDGFRYDYFRRINATNMDILKKNGVSVPYMRNQFITKTFPNHQTIVTGLYVESHGITDNEVFDPEFGKNLSATEDGNLFWNFRPDVRPIWTLNEEMGGNRHSGVMMWPGADVPYGENRTIPSVYEPWNDTVPFEKRIDMVAQWLSNKERPVNVVFLYFEEPDEIAHGFGPESANVTAQIEKMDNTTGYLVKKLKEIDVFDRTNLILLSDHGFYTVNQSNIINITGVVNPSLYYRYGSSPVLHISPVKDSDLESIYENFKNHGKENGHYSVYKKAELRPEWHYRENRRIAPIVLVAELDFVFDDFYSNIAYLNKKWNLTADPGRMYGAHGYDNRELPMHPFFIAHGPAFKRGYVAEPFDNVDLFPLMCHILGISAPANNGSLKHLPILATVGSLTFQNPIGWVFGAAVVLGLVVLTGILSLMVTRRKDKDLPFGVLENGYRYVSKSELLEVMDDGEDEMEYPLSFTHTRNEGSRFSDGLPHNGEIRKEASTSELFHDGNTDEIQALLLSSSNEEL